MSTYINGEKVVRWEYHKHGVTDEYPADTRHPFEVAMLINARAVFGPQQPAPALTVNHAHARKVHLDALSDGYAPGPPLNIPIGPRVPLRRQVSWGRIIRLATALAVAGFTFGSAVYVAIHGIQAI